MPFYLYSCSDGYLRIYLKGQETENAYDNPDHEVCGKALPQTVVSSGPRLVMVFSSGKYHGGRFKAHYKFETGKSWTYINFVTKSDVRKGCSW